MSDAEPPACAAEHPLASVQGLSAVLAVLVATGALCPECGHGTRVTSKRWARCTRCGARVPRGSVHYPEEAEDG